MERSRSYFSSWRPPQFSLMSSSSVLQNLQKKVHSTKYSKLQIRPTVRCIKKHTLRKKFLLSLSTRDIWVSSKHAGYLAASCSNSVSLSEALGLHSSWCPGCVSHPSCILSSHSFHCFPVPSFSSYLPQYRSTLRICFQDVLIHCFWTDREIIPPLIVGGN